MKILLISDTEEKFLWENWTKATADKLADVDLVLSAGDLNHLYLEFIVTMLNVPLVYVRGNHDGYYDDRLPAILDEVTKTSHMDVILKISLSAVCIAALITYCIFYVQV